MKYDTMQAILGIHNEDNYFKTGLTTQSQTVRR